MPTLIGLVSGATTVVVPQAATRVWVEVFGATTAEGLLEAQLHGPVEIAEGRGAELAIVLRPGRRIQGNVQFAGSVKGEQLMNAFAVPVRPHLLPAFPQVPLSMSHSSCAVQPDGSYLLEGLGDFSYTVNLDLPLEWALPDPVVVTLESGGNSETMLPCMHVVPAIRGTVRVLDAEGLPVDGARVRPYWVGPAGLARDVRHGGSVVWPLLSTRYFRTAKNGRVQIPGLSPSRVYRLLVVAPDERSDLVPVARVGAWRVGAEDCVVRFKSRAPSSPPTK